MNNSEPRAKSRIAKPITPEPEKPVVPVVRNNRLKGRPSFSTPTFSFPSFKTDSSATRKYLKATPFLVVSLGLYAVLLYIFTSIPPQNVAHWLLYQSYIPVITIFFFATVFLARFVLLNKNLAWTIGIWLTTLLFLKLQQYVLTAPVVIISALVFVGPSLIWPVLFRK